MSAPLTRLPPALDLWAELDPELFPPSGRTLGPLEDAVEIAARLVAEGREREVCETLIPRITDAIERAIRVLAPGRYPDRPSESP